MREHFVRGAALVLLLALVTAACSSSHKSTKSPPIVIPTVAAPTDGPSTSATTSVPKGTVTTAPGAPTTVPGSPTTVPGSPTTVPGTPTTVGTTTPPTFPGSGGVIMRWKLALDFRTHPGNNPFASASGGPPVWSLREGATLSRDGNYPLLPSFSSTYISSGLAAWHDNNPGCPIAPAVGVNLAPAHATVKVCTATVPGDAAFLIPAANHSAVVAWTSPFNGTVNISQDAIADADGSCGDGVSYFVDLGTQQLAAVRLTNNNAASLPAMRQKVTPFQTLYFIVDPGPGDNASCDATQLEVTVDRVA